MARLPSERYLVQDIGGRVVLFEDYTERELMDFEAFREAMAVAAQQLIAMLDELCEEDKCFAHFWSGYLHAHASGMQHELVTFGNLTLRPAVPVHPEAGDIVLEREADGIREVIVSYAAMDGNATARAQKTIHDQELLGDARPLAHFWSGYFWARHGTTDEW